MTLFLGLFFGAVGTVYLALDADRAGQQLVLGDVRLTVLAVVGITLVVAVFAIVRDGSSDQHRCGWVDGTIRCVSNDTPRNYKERGCAPVVRTEGLLVWLHCRKP